MKKSIKTIIALGLLALTSVSAFAKSKAALLSRLRKVELLRLLFSVIRNHSAMLMNMASIRATMFTLETA